MLIYIRDNDWTAINRSTIVRQWLDKAINRSTIVWPVIEQLLTDLQLWGSD